MAGHAGIEARGGPLTRASPHSPTALAGDRLGLITINRPPTAC